MTEMMYAIVEFQQSQSVDIIPVKWLALEEDACYWPPCSAVKASKLAQKLQSVDHTWQQYAIRVLGKAGR